MTEHEDTTVQDDVEGHRKPSKDLLGSDADVEGHRRLYPLAPEDDADVEGHRKPSKD